MRELAASTNTVQYSIVQYSTTSKEAPTVLFIVYVLRIKSGCDGRDE
eukprot:CAMPEP_0113894048 /NCGR_PEP_ID=MMETSP0780_2-20120614/16463_1 /TAXON_ID=652834 /ORGANISM="Palpitomonas bilix" /LENGTH=46 /DNA_ID=CAMNT_0000884469 /DNA_START=42 /DNA_END=179 /DNA_ORIENTATION=+ /assembly_acc=CAM_ASM_000599